LRVHRVRLGGVDILPDSLAQTLRRAGQLGAARNELAGFFGQFDKGDKDDKGATGAAGEERDRKKAP